MSENDLSQPSADSLRQAIVAAFNLEEVRSLIFDLGDVRFDQLAGATLDGKVVALIEYLDRRDRRPDLLASLARERPQIDWSRYTPADREAPPPFMGLAYFDEADAHLFFGRERLVADLIDHMTSHRFLAIIGASGSGKSSVTRAGLVPAARRGEIVFAKQRSDRWPIHLITPGDEPLKALAATLTRRSESVTAMKTLMGDMAHDEESLDLWLYRHLDGQDTRLLLVVDQFEELFTLCHDVEQRRHFVNNMVRAVTAGSTGRLSLILTLRADFYAQAVQYSSLVPLLEQRQRIVEGMAPEKLRQAIEGPLAHGGWSAQPGLIDTILADVGHEPGALPLLSHALLETWRRREGRQLTLSGYQAAGGVRRAIANTAENVYAQLSGEQQNLARNIFLRLTELGEGQEDTRRRARLQELAPAAGQDAAMRLVLQKLADTRLVTTGQDSAEVAHEALIREWPRLRRWLNENRDALRAHRKLNEAATAWEANRRDPSYLYRGARLEATQEQLSDSAGNSAVRLNETERAFLDASKQQRADELAEAREQASREAANARKLRQRAVFLVGALVIVAFLAYASYLLADQAVDSEAIARAEEANALTAEAAANLSAANAQTAEADAVIANATSVYNVNLQATRAAEAEAAQAAAEREQLEAERQAAIALSRQLASQAIGEFESGNAELALLLAIEASRSAPTIEALQMLRQMIEASLPWHVLTNQDGEPARSGTAHLSHDSRHVAIERGDDVHIYETATGNEAATLTGHTAIISSLMWSGDDSQILTSGADGTARVWDATTGSPLFRMAHQDWVWTASWSPDESLILTRSDDGSAGIWDAATGQLIHSLPGHEGGVQYIGWSQSGRQIVTTALSGRIRVWDADSGILQFTLVHEGEGSRFRIREARWRADDSQIISRGSDGTFRVWDVAAQEEIFSWSAAPGAEWISSLAWNADASRLLVGTSEGQVIVWNLTNGAIEISLDAHQEDVNTVAWNVDEQLFVSAGADNIVHVWDSQSGAAVATLGGPGREVRHPGWSPAGNRLAAIHCIVNDSGSDCNTRIWDLAGENQPQLALPNSFGNEPPLWSHNGHWLLTRQSETSGMIVWDLKGSSELPLSANHNGAVTSVAWHSERNLVLSTGEDGVVRIWNADAGVVANVLSGHAGAVWQASWRDDGRQILTAGEDGTARIWDAESGAELHRLAAPDGTPVGQARWSPDQRHIVVVSAGTVTLWDAETGQLEHALLDYRSLYYESAPTVVVLWNQESTRLLTAISGEIPIDDDVIRLWDIASGAELSTIIILARYDNLVDISWSEDENEAWVLNTLGELSLINLTTQGSYVFNDSFLDNFAITQIELNSEQSAILTGDASGTAHIWDAAIGVLQVAMPGHADEILTMQWSPDERQVLTAGADSTARIWDAASGAELMRIVGNGTPISHAAWNFDGSRLLLADSDGSLRQYFTDMEDLMTTACQRVTRNMTLEEWQRARGQEPYERTCGQLPYHESVNSNHYITLAEAKARDGDLPGAIALFEQALVLAPNLDFDPQARARQAAVFPLVQLGSRQAQQGLLDEALSAYAEALVMFGEPGDIDAADWHTLCFWGSIYDRAADVTHACDYAVDQSEFRRYHKSRGINRTLIGDFEGAIADFEIALDEAFLDAEREQITAWLASLRRNENPLDAETLLTLRDLGP